MSLEAVGPVLFLAALLGGGLMLGQLITSTPAQFPLIASAAVIMFFIGFFRTDIALMLLIFAMLLSPEIAIGSVGRRDIVIRLEDLLIVVMGMAWLAKAAVHKHFEIIPRTPINGWIAFYCATFLIATSQGILLEQVNPLKASFYILKYLEYYIIFYIACGSIKNMKQYHMYLGALFLTLVVVNIYGFSQIGHTERVSAPFEGKEGEPNTLGGYLVFMMCLAIGLYCHLRSRLQRWIVAASALLCVVPFLYTLSRASYMAIVPAVIALIAYAKGTPKRNELIFVFMTLAIASIYIFPPEVKERVLYTFNARPQENIVPVTVMGVQLDPSTSTRIWDWLNAFNYWKERPFFGYGITGRSFMDSQYINNLIETGALGFIAFTVLIAVLHRSVRRVYRTTDNDVVKGLALGFLAGNVGLLIHAITANTFILIRIMEPYWFVAAMILAWPRMNTQKPQNGPEPAAAAFSRRNISMLLQNANASAKGGADGT